MDKKTEQRKVFLDIVQQLRQLIKIEKISFRTSPFRTSRCRAILCERGIAKFRVIRSY